MKRFFFVFPTARKNGQPSGQPRGIRTYTDKDMVDALAAVASQAFDVKEVAAVYNIPKRTLYAKLK